MRSNYKQLGKCIRKVNTRNIGFKTTNLLGINIDKFFMPSVANIVGTDMSAYKIVKERQFACNRMHVGRDYRLPISISDSSENFLVSPAYDVFEVKDTGELLPEYLMMWFTRKEYDRNAWFYTDADVRGGLNWNAFAEMELPVPHIDKQREIVKEYNVLVDRINLNNQLIQKLEETVQVIYKQWFVDFEFPDENGKPYKSNGGEMEFNKELEKDIPKGWGFELLSSYIYYQEGPGIRNWQFTNNGVNFMNIRCINDGDINIDSCSRISTEEANNKYKHFLLNAWDIIMSTSGTLGKYAVVREDHLPLCLNTSIIRFKPKNLKSTFSYIFGYLTSGEFIKHLTDDATGSAQVNIGPSHIDKLSFLVPTFSIQKKFDSSIIPIFTHLMQVRYERKLLEEAKSILLSKMATINN